MAKCWCAIVKCDWPPHKNQNFASWVTNQCIDLNQICWHCFFFLNLIIELIQINIVLYVHYISACDLRTKSNTSSHSTPQHSSSDSEQPCDLRLFTPTTCLRELAVRDNVTFYLKWLKSMLKPHWNGRQIVFLYSQNLHRFSQSNFWEQKPFLSIRLFIGLSIDPIGLCFCVLTDYGLLQLPTSVLTVSPNAAVVTPSATALTDSLSNNQIQCSKVWILYVLIKWKNTNKLPQAKFCQFKCKLCLHSKSCIVECRLIGTKMKETKKKTSFLIKMTKKPRSGIRLKYIKKKKDKKCVNNGIPNILQALWRRQQQLLRQPYRWTDHLPERFITVEYQYFDRMKRALHRLWAVHTHANDVAIRTPGHTVWIVISALNVASNLNSNVLFAEKSQNISITLCYICEHINHDDNETFCCVMISGIANTKANVSGGNYGFFFLMKK